MTPRLETARLILRPVTLDDAPDIQRLFGTHEVIRYIGPVPWPYPEDGAITFLRDRQLPAMATGETLGWAITQKDSGILMGAVDVRPQGKDGVGFWIGLPYRQQGYMREATTAAYDYAFDVLGLERLKINNAVANTGSHTLQVNAGGELIEVTESSYDGGMQPQECWELTRDAWRASSMKRNAAEPTYVIR